MIYAYIPTPANQPPIEDGFYFVLSGFDTSYLYWYKGKWLTDESGMESYYVPTHWLKRTLIEYHEKI